MNNSYTATYGTQNPLDARIAQLRPGDSIEVSWSEAAHVTAERSGDGKRLRFVRHAGNTTVVFCDTEF